MLALNKGAAITSVVIAACHTVLIEAPYLWFAGLARGSIAYTSMLSFGLWIALSYWILGLRRWPFAVLSLIIFAELLCLFVAASYGVPAEANSIAFLAETDFAEAREFLGPATLTWLGVIAVAAAGSYLLFRRVLAPRRHQPHVVLAVIPPAIFAGLVLGMKFDRTAANPGTLHYPLVVELPMGIAIYAHERAITGWALAHRPAFSEIDFSGGDDVEAVLVIGESTRSANLGISGYARNTTPLLATKDIVNYRDIWSCEAQTRISVPCIVTQASVSDPMAAPAKVSLVTGFKRTGYASSWYSNHLVVGQYDSMVAAYANETDRQFFTRGGMQTKMDENMLPLARQHFSEPVQRRLTVLHTIGSHWNYRMRYDKRFEVFTPVCADERANHCSVEELTNAYDNSILNTDFFLASIIDMLADKPAFLIYTSDHGESLGEEGHYLHGEAGRPEQRHVPLIFWASPKFRERYPDRYAAARAHLGIAMNHDYIFHSMLDCAGIRSSVVDPKLSLCAAPGR